MFAVASMANGGATSSVKHWTFSLVEFAVGISEGGTATLTGHFSQWLRGLDYGEWRSDAGEMRKTWLEHNDVWRIEKDPILVVLSSTNIWTGDRLEEILDSEVPNVSPASEPSPGK
ncbi:hypothetical protein LWI29_000947 [Acer saccharum]|uniref:Uncharacterized protein n=1 Tax=Acer saccharum TaxID=4024 RepID=A0AA39S6R5_ACESA|nr:hypothetical protein LWI29_000947 [Acer saccharum]